MKVLAHYVKPGQFPEPGSNDVEEFKKFREAEAYRRSVELRLVALEKALVELRKMVDER